MLPRDRRNHFGSPILKMAMRYVNKKFIQKSLLTFLERFVKLSIHQPKVYQTELADLEGFLLLVPLVGQLPSGGC